MKYAGLAATTLLSVIVAPALGQGFSEGFGSGIPATWSIVDNFPIPGSPDYSAVPWTTNIPEGMDNYTGKPGQAATASSYNHPGQYDISLITPSFIVPSVPFGTSLAYDINFQRVDAFEFFDTNISIAGGPWITMVHDTSSLGAFYSAGPPLVHRGIDMAFFGAVAGSSVRVEFRYYSIYLLPMVRNEYVQIDDVTVVPSPGSGLIVGALLVGMRRRRR